MFGIAIVIGLLNVSMYSGNEEKETMVIVRGEIDTAKPLDAQLEQFTTIEIRKNESIKLGNSVVRNIKQLTGKRTTSKLIQGSPIPTSVLIEGNGFGQFASETKKYTTIYKLAGAVPQLPKGIKPGDKIDISILTQDGKADKRLDLVMTDLEVHSVTEADVYVLVSQEEFGKLTMLAELGKFVLQLPGQKVVPNCIDVVDPSSEDCYKETDKAGSITSSELMEFIRKGKVLNERPSTAKDVTDQPSNEEQPVQSDNSNQQQLGEQSNQQVEDMQERDSQISDFNGNQ